jgi:homoserine kinase
LLSSALEDRVHQPYRAPLCPLLPALKELTGDSGVLGAALSGAGPSVLVFLDPKVPTKRAKQRIAAHLAKRRLTAELVLTEIAQHGGRDGADWKKHYGPAKK